ncbi:MAG: uracil-DNA glycosylase [Geminicoccaceae bacterium]
MESAVGGTKGTIEAWLSWYAAMGVDGCVHDAPTAFTSDHRASRPGLRTDNLLRDDRRHPEQQHARSDRSFADASALAAGESDRAGMGAPVAASGGSPAQSPAVRNAREIAAACRTLAEIEQALQAFDGCALKRTANRLCFGDGSPDAPLMFIGEAPGAQEDRQGKPFVGPSGQLLDRMLATIGLDRSKVWITNSIFWRPPGNRPPTDMEIAVCQPFLERQVEILDPEIIVFVGGTAARTLLGAKEGVTRLRGRKLQYPVGDRDRNIPAIVMFHPAYLLRQPIRKKDAWNDLLTIGEWLEDTGGRSIH